MEKVVTFSIQNSAVNVDTVVIGNKRPASDEEVNEVVGSKPTRARPNWLDSAVAPPIVQKSLVKMALPKVKTVLSTGLRPEDPTVVMECHNTEDAQSKPRIKSYEFVFLDSFRFSPCQVGRHKARNTDLDGLSVKCYSCHDKQRGVLCSWV